MVINRISHFLTTLFVVLITSLILSNCSPWFRKKALSPDQISLRELKERVDRNFLTLETLRGKARIQVQMKDLAYEASSEVKIRMPDSLYLKMEVIFGIDVGSFFGNRKLFKIYSPQENIFYTGSLDSFTLAKFFQINLTYSNLLEAFTGTPTIVSGKTSRLAVDNGKFKLSSLTKKGLHRYWIDPEKFVITKYQFHDRKGKLRIEKHFKSFKKHNDIYLPKSIQIKKPLLNQYFSLFYTSQKVNKIVSPKEFKIKVPRNCKWIKL